MKEQSKVKRRIAFVSPNAWTMYNFRREVLQSILQNGFEIIIIAGNDKYAELLVSMGCLFIPVTIKNHSLRLTDDLLLYLRLRKIYKQYHPDFIFHYVAKPNIYGTIAARLLNIPSVAVITGLGHAFNKNNLLKVLIKRLYQFSLRYAHEVWCLNADDADYFVRHKIVSIQKIKTLPGEGVNIEHFKKDSIPRKQRNIFTFLMSARLLKSKGVTEYANAALMLNQKDLRFRCLLVGAREQHPDAISSTLITRWQQQPGFFYLGFIDDIRIHLAEADCFVYPSYYNEGIPRSLLEACSLELSVITTDNTGCRNLVQDGINGFLCNKRDPVSLAAKMEKMIKLDCDQRVLMGARSRKIVEANYNMDIVVTCYIRLLKTYFG
ncbi:MAG: glycosyltransferase family 4 protein [Chitinophagaceae bacterium]